MAKVKILNNKNNSSNLKSNNEYSFSINSLNLNNKKINSKIAASDYSYVLFDLKYTFFISFLLLTLELVIFTLTKNNIIRIPTI